MAPRCHGAATSWRRVVIDRISNGAVQDSERIPNGNDIAAGRTRRFQRERKKIGCHSEATRTVHDVMDGEDQPSVPPHSFGDDCKNTSMVDGGILELAGSQSTKIGSPNIHTGRHRSAGIETRLKIALAA